VSLVFSAKSARGVSYTPLVLAGMISP
jgi:hypothetical protein